MPDAAVTEARTPAPAAPPHKPSRAWMLPVLLIALLAGAAMWVTWNTQRRLQTFEQELVRRQQDVQEQSAEARLLARQSQDAARDAAAKLALLDARVAESAAQRSQVEDLVQSLTRSRDENVLSDVDAGLRVALQQSAITGSVEPLVATLKQIDERLARLNQPGLERVRRAVALDLERVKAVASVDVAGLAARLDDAGRMVDELPMQVAMQALAPADNAAAAATARAPDTPASAPAWNDFAAWPQRIWSAVLTLAQRAWVEARSLVRVSQVANPDAVMLAPDQAYFVRENLKLRLLNTRLALLSRQFDVAQADLREALGVIQRYFDGQSKRVALMGDLLRQVAEQAQQVSVPRPDETLAALAAATAGR